MSKPWAIPDHWQHKDWDSLCDDCGQALFMVAIAEKALPASGYLEVTRCPGCTRALWYRSNATPINVEQYRLHIIQKTKKRYRYKPKRPPETRGLRKEQIQNAAH
ncbi:MAG: hypothetical protein NVS2B16_25660 [Chloroflexota bacterium]